jgi:hypothetical protein
LILRRESAIKDRVMSTSRKSRAPIRFPRLSLAFLLLSVLSLSPLLSRPSSDADIPFAWTNVERVVAIADLHGDYERFVFILTNPTVGILDENLSWAAGKTHLVQLGDIMDRGPEAKRIFDLLIRLEKEAEAAGGMVHMLLGNHEEMNITGIALGYPRYVTVEQFVSFLPPDFRKAREAQFLRSLPASERKRPIDEGPDAPMDERFRVFWQGVIDGKDPESLRAYVLGFNDAYGDWLLKKNIVIKINDVIFTHGGISEALSKWPLRELNTVMRSELEFFQARMKNPQRYKQAFKPKLVYEPDSPVWFRGFVSKNEQSAQAEVDRTLANLGARAMVVGHNIMRSNGSSLVIGKESVAHYQDKVWIMDTGISSIYGGIPSAWICDKGQVTVWGETEEVAEQSAVKLPPAGALSQADMEAFLKTAAVKDRAPGPGGRTDAWRITLEAGGVVRQAIFKYIDRRRPDVLADSYKYELAAFALGKGLGLGFVPPVVEREIEGMRGSLQVFVENTIPESERKERKLKPKNPAAFERAMADLRVFENLAYDNCHDEKDTLVRLSDGSVSRVDFSEAFAPKKDILPRCDIGKCSKQLYARLLAWDDAAVGLVMRPYLNDEEIRALNSRRELVVRLIKKMIAIRGEENVLF